MIVTEDLSRISRDSADLHLLHRTLEYEGIRLVGVGDGLDTKERGSKLTFALKSMVVSVYIDDLRDKTRRGLGGRALAGFSTGGLPFGYGSRAQCGPDGKSVGSVVEIREEQWRYNFGSGASCRGQTSDVRSNAPQQR